MDGGEATELDLSLAFASVGVSHQANSTAAEHPRFSLLYKDRGFRQEAASQSSRRKDFLKRQKEKQHEFLDKCRKLANTDKSSSGQGSSRNRFRGQHQYQNPYKNTLMLSEWLIDLPEDLAENWIMVPSPEGKRTLVVASNTVTTAYSKTGYTVATFRSYLPGGGAGPDYQNGYTMLDCIFSEKEKTFYVLDVISWRKNFFSDSDTECRFFMKSSLLNDLPEALTISPSTKYCFFPLPSVECSSEGIHKFLNSPLPFSVPIDGLLFYHKSVCYIPGTTPAVGWLKPYMVPLVLNVNVPNEFLLRMPPTLLLQHYPHLATPAMAKAAQDMLARDAQKMQAAASAVSTTGETKPLGNSTKKRGARNRNQMQKEECEVFEDLSKAVQGEHLPSEASAEQKERRQGALLTQTSLLATNQVAVATSTKAEMEVG